MPISGRSHLRRLLTSAVAASVAALALSVTPAASLAHAAGDGASSTSTATDLTEAQASAQAQATGNAVDVDAATTPTDELTANPDGTFTLTQAIEPVRKRVDGAWKSLDSTLAKNSDGTISPGVTTSDLTLSGGGTGPLATLKTYGRSLALTLPVTLPAPTLSGDTATYANVLTGVDLTVTADTQGGFSEVFVVKDATAAANPALKTLTFATKTTGVNLATDAAGNITANDPTGATDFSAPAPIMWDSATSSSSASTAASTASYVTTQADAADTTTTDPQSGDPATSSTDGPGADAHTAPIAADYSADTIKLTPDPSLLTGSSTVYPLYIDPTYSASGGKLQAWTYVNSYYSGTSFWKTTDSVGLRVGYQGWDAPYYIGRAFAQMSVSSDIYGATVESSHFYATETYAPSCDSRTVQLWRTGKISSSTDWDHQPSWVDEIDTADVAHGWSTSCPTASVGFDTKSMMQTAADSSWSNVTLGLKAASETDRYGWKKFDHAAMYMSTTYDHVPNTPTSPHTSPTTTCSSTIKTVGNGDVTLYARVSDPDEGTLSTTFKAWKTSSSSTTIASKTLSATSGTVPSFILKKTTLDSFSGSTSAMKVSWNVHVSDGTYTSGSSTTCTFNFDPTTPGAPSLSDTTGADCGDSDSAASYAVGTAASFTITPNSGGTTPSGYVYQLNGAAPITTTKTSFSIKPTRGTDAITVTALSAGGNVGDSATCVINASAAATAPDGDLTSDGIADLAVVGKQANLPAGLWLAQGQAGTGHTQGDGQIIASAADIGAQGTAVNTNGSPADWTGTQAITGHFTTGDGFNDVLDYDPTTGAGHILNGNGDGSALSPSSGAETNVAINAFEDTETGVTATHVASGGNLYNTAGDSDITGFPDLLLTLEGHLYLEPASAIPGAYSSADGAQDLADTNPTGSGDWTGWTISTTLIGGLPAMFTRSDTGGQLYYYSPDNMLNLAEGNTVTPIELATSGWTTSDIPLLQAADINTDSTPDVWAVTSAGTATAYTFNGTSTLTAQTAQALTADSHTWALNDGPAATATDTIVGTATDSSGATALPLTGGGSGTQWDSGDLFDPDITLSGTSTGVLTTTTHAMTLSAGFSVSVWAKPTVTGGVVLSQDGINISGFTLYPDTSTNDWYFCLPESGSVGATQDCAHGGSVHLGTWTHLTATYNATTSRAALYEDGIEISQATHTAVSGFVNQFNVGQQRTSSTAHGTYFTGSVADVQAWAGTALTPTQVAALSGTPGYVLFPSDGTNYASGSTWTTASGKMTFSAGLLTITETGSCASSCTWTEGATGHSSAVLTFQSDGNLVIYPQAAHTTGTALWASGTSSHPNDTLFFQPDGNLVIYDSDGAVLWSSHTYN